MHQAKGRLLLFLDSDVNIPAGGYFAIVADAIESRNLDSLWWPLMLPPVIFSILQKP